MTVSLQQSTEKKNKSGKGGLEGANQQTGVENSSNQNFLQMIGDTLNYANVIINIILTSLAMMQFPSKDFYDDWWTPKGFCVNQNHKRVLDTEMVCFITLAGSSLVLYFFHRKNQHVMNEQLCVKLSGGIFANFAHGFGHLFLLLLGDAPPPKMEASMTLEGIGNIIVTFLFFVGVFRSILIHTSVQGAAVMASVVLVAQYMLDVPPGLAFTYSQSVILLAAAMDQLSLPAHEKGVTYAIVAASYIPLLCLYVLEMTVCTNTLAYFGGHALYDAYLSALPFLLFYSVRYYETKTQVSMKDKKV